MNGCPCSAHSTTHSGVLGLLVPSGSHRHEGQEVALPGWAPTPHHWLFPLLPACFFLKQAQCGGICDLVLDSIPLPCPADCQPGSDSCAFFQHTSVPLLSYHHLPGDTNSSPGLSSSHLLSQPTMPWTTFVSDECPQAVAFTSHLDVKCTTFNLCTTSDLGSVGGFVVITAPDWKQ